MAKAKHTGRMQFRGSGDLQWPVRYLVQSFVQKYWLHPDDIESADGSQRLLNIGFNVIKSGLRWRAIGHCR
jgi:hypothetical protein